MKNSIDFKGLEKFIREALEEDIGTGDITTNAVISDNEVTVGKVIAKEDLILCGLNIFEYVFLCLDKNIKIDPKHADGEKVKNRSTLLTFSGSARSLLAGERVALNILQRLSGIATLTMKFVEKVPSTVSVLDTRKTTPGMRALEKYAVRCGGGTNHRFGLYDAVLIKDNHIKAAGSISKAVEKARKNIPPLQKIEVEVKNAEEVKEALRMECDIIMLDNMSPEQVKEAVKIINKRSRIEISGNIGLSNIQKIASEGIDYISVGALTHSTPTVDISMVFD
ncbi:MAG TPA: carboxylating nicotinate-nucleotide diphosphorylase [Nitrospinota bacterium]|jgi:nicotinate-nucleotide pyrophosphorylase (carboxylating)|nr:carboxylating nicotinate-nucleotide diphosphorylase [Nitrospinota bacterium]|tara:strand:+ start:767 stop:1606 length:840 start_codon:yes stop_codon:yes gene_type:complete